MYRDFGLPKAKSQRSLYLRKKCVQVVLLCQFYLTYLGTSIEAIQVDTGEYQRHILQYISVFHLYISFYISYITFFFLVSVEVFEYFFYFFHFFVLSFLFLLDFEILFWVFPQLQTLFPPRTIVQTLILRFQLQYIFSFFVLFYYGSSLYFLSTNITVTFSIFSIFSLSFLFFK